LWPRKPSPLLGLRPILILGTQSAISSWLCLVAHTDFNKREGPHIPIVASEKLRKHFRPK
jgi:hypothetical protein